MDSNHPSWAALLERAVTEPGIISSAYTQFGNFSIGNQLLAWAQCEQRGIPLGALATFVRWKELGRHVKRGEKALTLCQPVTIRRTSEAHSANDAPEAEILVRFMYRPRWFVLAQTDGQELPPAEIPSWDKARALAALHVQEVPFECPDGNVMGYARKRDVAISPLNPLSYKTLFHELAHILLGHTSEDEQAESEITPRSLREAEAESVALICCEALDLDGAAQSRGYIQSWWGTGNPIPERSAQSILRVADQILRAGREAESADPEARA
jgi:antirestriction protein ArdC